ncbi:MAG TPA: hypothetical protein VJL59_10885 [Anaerolineales bacterium]|nr:hypothetical protein [Anaerolineales bacterium]
MAKLLRLREAALLCQASAFGSQRWLGLLSALGNNSGLLDEPRESLEGILTVTLLAPELSCVDDQVAVGGYMAGGQPYQLLLHIWAQGARGANIEPYLDGSGDLVDVLAARPRSADELALSRWAAMHSPIANRFTINPCPSKSG